eukprot:CAMPEP_0169130242 /NCGR_PEP_ID=MMETSP1015-20121227/37591_1 /TAXON_ID=342587 /ORGANISM="Karlodinium micrum, Strain CCMP2283" /LENGTH=72 /DNA_ID=CAMNT_0009194387 /DNA_START=207 /DNA_END=425 /DNA_ORIENTATION=+
MELWVMVGDIRWILNTVERVYEIIRVDLRVKLVMLKLMRDTLELLSIDYTKSSICCSSKYALVNPMAPKASF